MRLIDADALASEFARKRDCDPTVDNYRGYASHFLNSAQEPSTEWESVENALENAPTIDAIPVKHGHWIFKRRSWAECSECHHDYNDAYDMENADNYCRFCGAKMDGERRDKDGEDS